jgi:CubicO group peptidase (beta-lactamase class C family)
MMNSSVFGILRKSALVLAAVALLAYCGNDAAFDKQLEQQFEKTGLPGVAVGVFRGGKIVYERAFGKADIDKGIAMRTDMAFEVGSVSKQFVGVCILMLTEDGKLRLDEPLGEALPSSPSVWHKVTIEQLLWHTSGVPDYEAIAGYDFYNKTRIPKEVFEQALKKAMDFEPGEKFSYSNTGYFLLSQVVEHKAGIPFEEFLESRIFRPLGMDSTYSASRPAGVTAATGHHSRSGERRAQPPIAWSSTLGAGGIVSTIADMIKWDQALYGEKLLPWETLDKVWKSGKLNDGRKTNYGFGWSMGDFRGISRQRHSGQTNGFTCVFMRLPQLHTSVLAWTNTYGGRGVSSIATSALAHSVHSLSYHSKEIPADPDPVRTLKHLKALRQAVLAEGDLDLLTENMKKFATEDRYKWLRESVAPMVKTTKKWEFLSVTKRQSGRQVFLYKQSYEGGVLFWIMPFDGEVLTGLDWENE